MATQVVLPDEITERGRRGDAGAHRSPRRRRSGTRLVILGHHYQRDEVIRHADFTGDSFKLAQLAAVAAGGGVHRLLRRPLHGGVGGHPLAPTTRRWSCPT